MSIFLPSNRIGTSSPSPSLIYGSSIRIHARMRGAMLMHGLCAWAAGILALCTYAAAALAILACDESCAVDAQVRGP